MKMEISEIRKIVYGFRKETLGEMFVEIIHKASDADTVLARLKWHDTINDYAAKVEKANKLADTFHRLTAKQKRSAKGQRKLKQLEGLRNHLEKHPGAKLVEEMVDDFKKNN